MLVGISEKELPYSDVKEKMWFVCGNSPVPCDVNHKLTGTAVFYQSLGVLQCNSCGGYQAIKKPLN